MLPPLSIWRIAMERFSTEGVTKAARDLGVAHQQLGDAASHKAEVEAHLMPNQKERVKQAS
jgi:hypothetical protein